MNGLLQYDAVRLSQDELHRRMELHRMARSATTDRIGIVESLRGLVGRMMIGTGQWIRGTETRGLERIEFDSVASVRIAR